MQVGECRLRDMDFSYSGDFRDTVTEMYEYLHANATDTAAAIKLAAESTTTGDALPYRRKRYGEDDLFAERFDWKRRDGHRSLWDITVTYETPQAIAGTSDVAAYMDLHPLFWPARMRIEYLEKEKVVEKARNVEPLINRDTGTLGPVVNGALKESLVPKLRVKRDSVIVISYNFATTEEVLNINDAFELSTNGNQLTVFNRVFEPRTLMYMGTDSSNREEFEGIGYYPTETRIAIMETTDFTINSNGFDYLDGFETKTWEGSDPVFIKLDGTLSDNEGRDPVTITYRDLEELDYTPLLGGS